MLVTGAAGFLGPHVIAAARAAWPAIEVVGLDLRDRSTADRTLVVDLKDASATRAALEAEEPDVVFHLAGRLGGTIDQLYAANVTATANLLGAIGAGSHRARVVVPGSAAEYGAVPEAELPVSEDRPPAPVSFYGRSKAQQVALALEHAHAGLNVGVGRVFQMLGPGMPETLFAGSACAQFAAIAAAGGSGEVKVGDLTPRRDFLDVTDVASALVTIATSGPCGEVYNVCSGTSVSMSELLEMMVEATGLDVRVVRDTDRLRASDVPDSRGDNAKLRSLGWEPRLTLAESVARAAGEAVCRA